MANLKMHSERQGSWQDSMIEHGGHIETGDIVEYVCGDFSELKSIERQGLIHIGDIFIAGRVRNSYGSRTISLKPGISCEDPDFGFYAYCFKLVFKRTSWGGIFYV